MTDFIKTQNSFAHGAVSSRFYMSDNIHGLSRLENMDVLSGGGLTRRAGLCTIDTVRTSGRLIPFVASDNYEYLIVLQVGHIYIYRNGVRYQDILSSWTLDEINQMQYAQRFDTIIFVHPNFRPHILKYSNGLFSQQSFAFSRNRVDYSLNMPFVRFDDSTDINISVTANSTGNNYATFTTNQDYWTPDCVEDSLQLLGRQWTIVEYISPTQVIANTNGTYSLPSEPVTDWAECAFGRRRGWPTSITFHQDRLVFGGSRGWPCGIWMSCVGRHTDFSSGTGLDDEAIFISIQSRVRQHICTVVSGDALQVLTNVGEWAISNIPLTPSSVNIRQHTSIGAFASRYLPPQRIEGSTVFVSRTGTDIRELCLDDFGERYNATDLCPMAKHLLTSPIDIAYNDTTRQLFIVCEDGTMAVLNHNPSLGISAWAKYTTNGAFLSVGICGGKTYVLLERQNQVYLECFDINALCDGAGYAFPFIASGLPLRIGHHNARKLRVRKIIARVIDTKSISINNHHVALPNSIQYDTAAGYSGDVIVNLLGTTIDSLVPLWTIHSLDAKPATILSVTTNGWYDV